MLLTSLTPDELERLSFLHPEIPGVGAAMAQVTYRELLAARDEITSMEETAQELQGQIDELAAEVPA